MKTIYNSQDDINLKFKRFLESLYQNYLFKKKKKILIDKSAHHLYSMDFLSKLYGKKKIKFIFLFRDGLDVANSLASYKETFNFVKGKTYNSKFESALNHWISYNYTLLKNLKKYKILLIRYESLQADPEKETKKICNFIKQKYNSEILNFSKFYHDKGLGDKKILKTKYILEKKKKKYRIKLSDEILKKYFLIMKKFKNFS